MKPGYYQEEFDFQWTVLLKDAYSRATNLRLCADLAKQLGVFYFSLSLQNECVLYAIPYDGWPCGDGWRIRGDIYLNRDPYSTYPRVGIYDVDMASVGSYTENLRTLSYGFPRLDIHPDDFGAEDASFYLYQLDRSPDQMRCP